MRAVLFEAPGRPLVERELPDPSPGPGELLIDVGACGVCRTDLHLIDGELPDPRLPVVPGHQIVGRVAALGDGVASFEVGDRVGVPWLGRSCGVCRYCAEGSENLCDDALYTGYQVDGGYAERCVATADFCLPLPDGYDDVEVAPLLCAGLIGFRALRMTGGAQRLGFYGFGASAHILIQIANAEGRRVQVFTRPGDDTAQRFARKLGAVWAGGSDESPPEELDAAIVFAPVGALVPAALRAVRKGGVVVCAGIHMSDIPSFPYSILWGERSIRSVANLTREDGRAFFAAAALERVNTTVQVYPLADAPQALEDLRAGRLSGAAVLEVRARPSRRTPTGSS